MKTKITIENKPSHVLKSLDDLPYGLLEFCRDGEWRLGLVGYYRNHHKQLTEVENPSNTWTCKIPFPIRPVTGKITIEILEA